MSYRNQYSGSPWQQGGPPFGVGGYNQGYGGYSDQYGVSHQMMNAGYNRNQGYGGMGYGGGMGQMRNMGYGGQSRHYMNDRMGGRSMPRGQMQRKRLPQRSPASGPRSKRPNIESDRRSLKGGRRRRDSRGGSKGRTEHSDDEEEDDTYNPEEPTDDLSDVDCDLFEAWKSSDDEGDGGKASKENGEKEEAADEDKESKDDDGKPKKPLICYVCKVSCGSRERLTRHQSSKSHTEKIDALLAIRRESKKDASDDDKKDKDSADHDKKKPRKSGNWCTVCECAFTGNFLAHRRTKEHRKKRDKKYPKCRPCRLGFSSSEEYRDHYKSEDHKQRSAEFHYLKNLASGSDDDEAAIEPVKVEDDKTDEVEKMEEEASGEAQPKADGEATEDQEKNEEEKSDEEKKDSENKDAEKKDEQKQEVKKRPKEPKAVGQSFVISVQGYYCKLCHKFFKDVTVAKSKHCRSIMHAEAFKKAMEEAIEQEEDRQKLAEEQDRIDKEAAEAAELASEIAAIERQAKEEARKELAAKKAGQTKSEDVEMKDVSAEGKSDEKEEKMDGLVEVKTENGVNEEEEAQEAEPVETKDESVVEDKSKEVSVKEEEQPDEEPEESKEETTASPATRRGRGRGRGRKRR